MQVVRKREERKSSGCRVRAGGTSWKLVSRSAASSAQKKSPNGKKGEANCQHDGKCRAISPCRSRDVEKPGPNFPNLPTRLEMIDLDLLSSQFSTYLSS